MKSDGVPSVESARRFVVTGANGFIGDALCRRLRKLGEVRAVLRRPMDGPWDTSIQVDLARDELPMSALEGADTVFHLASRTHDVKEESGEAAYEAVNIRGTEKLLQVAARSGVRRIVFLSSVKAMGEGSREPQDESVPPRPTTAYGRTKLAAEERVLRGGFVPEAVVLRLPLVYGPGVKGNLARMIDAIDRGRFPPVPAVDNRRSMIHVDDVVDAALLAAVEPGAVGRVFIVTDGQAYSTRRIYDTIRRALGKPDPKVSVPLAVLRVLAVCGDAAGMLTRRRWPFDGDAYRKLLGSAFYDGTAARETLGFEPQRTLEGEMPAIVEAFRRPGSRRSPSRSPSGDPPREGHS